MAYNEVITYVLCFGIFVCGFMVGELRARAVCAEKTEKLSQYRFDAGWNEAKQYYYLDKKKIEEQENLLLVKENAGYTPGLSELLMAYGVSRVTQLPRNVRETYGLDDKNFNIDLDTLQQEDNDEF